MPSSASIRNALAALATLAVALLAPADYAAVARAAQLPASVVPIGLPATPYVEVSGDAEARVAPDIAYVDFGVVARADTAAAAVQQNAVRMKSVLAAIRKILGAKAQIGTGNYSVHAEYAPVRDGTPPKVIGYSATNTVRIETAELERLGELIDAATQAGANQVQRLTFGLRDAAEPRRQALRDAVADARAKAEAIAAAAGLRLGTVHSVLEQDTAPIRPLAQDFGIARSEAAQRTPIEPGLVTLRARVVLRMEFVR